MKKTMKSVAVSKTSYVTVLNKIKKYITEAQLEASIAANKQLISLYWHLGKIIAEQQEKSARTVVFADQLAADLAKEFPGIAGFSRTNISRMRSFYLAYQESFFADEDSNSSVIKTLPWGHNVVLLEKLKNHDERLFYAHAALEHGWSRSTLAMHIESKLYKRQGKSITNFSRTLPEPHSDCAQQSLKDPYLFDFLLLQEAHAERDIEQGLLNHIQKFLLELGQGFAFVGRQVHLEVDKKDYYVDLLFYHVTLRCYIAIELKAREFDPRDIGQIGFYLAAIDDKLKLPDDKPTIGLLLCQTKSKVTVEYALRMTANPIAVSSYTAKIVDTLPKELKGKLPTTQEIENEFKKANPKKRSIGSVKKKKPIPSSKKSTKIDKVAAKKAVFKKVIRLLTSR